jgi:hypothetical protein
VISILGDVSDDRCMKVHLEDLVFGYLTRQQSYQPISSFSCRSHPFVLRERRAPIELEGCVHGAQHAHLKGCAGGVYARGWSLASTTTELCVLAIPVSQARDFSTARETSHEAYGAACKK